MRLRPDVAVMFISRQIDGHYYLAQRSRIYHKFIWTKVPHAPTHNGIRIEAGEVPKIIRDKAYKLFEGDRKRAPTCLFHQL